MTERMPDEVDAGIVREALNRAQNSSRGLDEVFRYTEAITAFDRIVRAKADLAMVEPTRPEDKGEIKRLSHILECERTSLADGLNKIDAALNSHDWLWMPETNRGSYDWDDETWKSEFGVAVENIRKAVEPLRHIARDWSDCPRTWAEVQEARKMLTPQPEAQNAETILSALKRDGCVE